MPFPCSFFAYACMRINIVYKAKSASLAWSREPNGLQTNTPDQAVWPSECSTNTGPDFALMDNGKVVMVGEGKVRFLSYMASSLI